MELSPLRAGTAHTLEFLSRIAFQSGANSAKMAEAALRKFNSINLVDPACLDSPAIRTLLTGASNLVPGPSKQLQASPQSEDCQRCNQAKGLEQPGQKHPLGFVSSHLLGLRQDW